MEQIRQLCRSLCTSTNSRDWHSVEVIASSVESAVTSFLDLNPPSDDILELTESLIESPDSSLCTFISIACNLISRGEGCSGSGKEDILSSAIVRLLKLLRDVIKTPCGVYISNPPAILDSLVICTVKVNSADIRTAVLTVIHRVLRPYLYGDTSLGRNGEEIIYPTLQQIESYYDTLWKIMNVSGKTQTSVLAVGMKVLGLISQLFPTDQKVHIERLIEVCFQVLFRHRGGFSGATRGSTTGDDALLAGSLSGLDRCLRVAKESNFQRASLPGLILDVISPERLEVAPRFAAASKALRFLRYHAPKYRSVLGSHAELFLSALRGAQKKGNLEKHSEAALFAVTSELSIFVRSEFQRVPSEASKRCASWLLAQAHNAMKRISSYTSADYMSYRDSLLELLAFTPAVASLENGDSRSLWKGELNQTLGETKFSHWVVMEASRYTALWRATNAIRNNMESVEQSIGGDPFINCLFLSVLFTHIAFAMPPAVWNASGNGDNHLAVSIFEGENKNEYLQLRDIILSKEIRYFIEVNLPAAVFFFSRTTGPQLHHVKRLHIQSLFVLNLLSSWSSVLDSGLRKCHKEAEEEDWELSRLCESVCTSHLEVLVARSVSRRDDSEAVNPYFVTLSLFSEDIDDHLLPCYLSLWKSIFTLPTASQSGGRVVDSCGPILMPISSETSNLLSKRVATHSFRELVGLLTRLELESVAVATVGGAITADRVPSNVIDHDVLVTLSGLLCNVLRGLVEGSINTGGRLILEALVSNGTLLDLLDVVITRIQYFPELSPLYAILAACLSDDVWGCLSPAVNTHTLDNLRRICTVTLKRLRTANASFRDELLNTAIWLLLCAPHEILKKSDLAEVIEVSLVSSVHVDFAMQRVADAWEEDVSYGMDLIHHLAPLLAVYYTPSGVTGTSTANSGSTSLSRNGSSKLNRATMTLGNPVSCSANIISSTTIRTIAMLLGRLGGKNKVILASATEGVQNEIKWMDAVELDIQIYKTDMGDSHKLFADLRGWLFGGSSAPLVVNNSNSNDFLEEKVNTLSFRLDSVLSSLLPAAERALVSDQPWKLVSTAEALYNVLTVLVGRIATNTLVRGATYTLERYSSVFRKSLPLLVKISAVVSGVQLATENLLSQLTHWLVKEAAQRQGDVATFAVVYEPLVELMCSDICTVRQRSLAAKALTGAATFLWQLGGHADSTTRFLSLVIGRARMCIDHPLTSYQQSGVALLDAILRSPVAEANEIRGSALSIYDLILRGASNATDNTLLDKLSALMARVERLIVDVQSSDQLQRHVLSCFDDDGSGITCTLDSVATNLIRSLLSPASPAFHAAVVRALRAFDASLRTLCGFDIPAARALWREELSLTNDTNNSMENTFTHAQFSDVYDMSDDTTFLEKIHQRVSDLPTITDGLSAYTWFLKSDTLTAQEILSMPEVDSFGKPFLFTKFKSSAMSSINEDYTSVSMDKVCEWTAFLKLLSELLEQLTEGTDGPGDAERVVSQAISQIWTSQLSEAFLAVLTSTVLEPLRELPPDASLISEVEIVPFDTLTEISSKSDFYRSVEALLIHSASLFGDKSSRQQWESCLTSLLNECSQVTGAHLAKETSPVHETFRRLGILLDRVYAPGASFPPPPHQEQLAESLKLAAQRAILSVTSCSPDNEINPLIGSKSGTDMVNGDNLANSVEVLLRAAFLFEASGAPEQLTMAGWTATGRGATAYASYLRARVRLAYSRMAKDSVTGAELFYSTLETASRSSSSSSSCSIASFATEFASGLLMAIVAEYTSTVACPPRQLTLSITEALTAISRKPEIILTLPFSLSAALLRAECAVERLTEERAGGDVRRACLGQAIRQFRTPTSIQKVLSMISLLPLLVGGIVDGAQIHARYLRPMTMLMDELKSTLTTLLGVSNTEESSLSPNDKKSVRRAFVVATRQCGSTTLLPVLLSLASDPSDPIIARFVLQSIKHICSCISEPIDVIQEHLTEADNHLEWLHVYTIILESIESSETAPGLAIPIVEYGLLPLLRSMPASALLTLLTSPAVITPQSLRIALRISNTRHSGAQPTSTDTLIKRVISGLTPLGNLQGEAVVRRGLLSREVALLLVRVTYEKLSVSTLRGAITAAYVSPTTTYSGAELTRDALKTLRSILLSTDLSSESISAAFFVNGISLSTPEQKSSLCGGCSGPVGEWLLSPADLAARWANLVFCAQVAVAAPTQTAERLLTSLLFDTTPWNRFFHTTSASEILVSAPKLWPDSAIEAEDDELLSETDSEKDSRVAIGFWSEHAAHTYDENFGWLAANAEARARLAHQRRTFTRLRQHANKSSSTWGNITSHSGEVTVRTLMQHSVYGSTAKLGSQCMAPQTLGTQLRASQAAAETSSQALSQALAAAGPNLASKLGSHSLGSSISDSNTTIDGVSRGIVATGSVPGWDDVQIWLERSPPNCIPAMTSLVRLICRLSHLFGATWSAQDTPPAWLVTVIKSMNNACESRSGGALAVFWAQFFMNPPVRQICTPWASHVVPVLLRVLATHFAAPLPLVVVRKRCVTTTYLWRDIIHAICTTSDWPKAAMTNSESVNWLTRVWRQGVNSLFGGTNEIMNDNGSALLALVNHVLAPHSDRLFDLPPPPTTSDGILKVLSPADALSIPVLFEIITRGGAGVFGPYDSDNIALRLSKLRVVLRLLESMLRKVPPILLSMSPTLLESARIPLLNTIKLSEKKVIRPAVHCLAIIAQRTLGDSISKSITSLLTTQREKLRSNSGVGLEAYVCLLDGVASEYDVIVTLEALFPALTAFRQLSSQSKSLTLRLARRLAESTPDRATWLLTPLAQHLPVCVRDTTIFTSNTNGSAKAPFISIDALQLLTALTSVLPIELLNILTSKGGAFESLTTPATCLQVRLTFASFLSEIFNRRPEFFTAHSTSLSTSYDHRISKQTPCNGEGNIQLACSLSPEAAIGARLVALLTRLFSVSEPTTAVELNHHADCHPDTVDFENRVLWGTPPGAPASAPASLKVSSTATTMILSVRASIVHTVSSLLPCDHFLASLALLRFWRDPTQPSSWASLSSTVLIYRLLLGGSGNSKISSTINDMLFSQKLLPDSDYSLLLSPGMLSSSGALSISSQDSIGESNHNELIARAQRLAPTSALENSSTVLLTLLATTDTMSTETRVATSRALTQTLDLTQRHGLGRRNLGRSAGISGTIPTSNLGRGSGASWTQLSQSSTTSKLLVTETTAQPNTMLTPAGVNTIGFDFEIGGDGSGGGIESGVRLTYRAEFSSRSTHLHSNTTSGKTGRGNSNLTSRSNTSLRQLLLSRGVSAARHRRAASSSHAGRRTRAFYTGDLPDLRISLKDLSSSFLLSAVADPIICSTLLTELFSLTERLWTGISSLSAALLLCETFAIAVEEQALVSQSDSSRVPGDAMVLGTQYSETNIEDSSWVSHVLIENLSSILSRLGECFMSSETPPAIVSRLRKLFARSQKAVLRAAEIFSASGLCAAVMALEGQIWSLTQRPIHELSNETSSRNANRRRNVRSRNDKSISLTPGGFSKETLSEWASTPLEENVVDDISSDTAESDDELTIIENNEDHKLKTEDQPDNIASSAWRGLLRLYSELDEHDLLCATLRGAVGTHRSAPSALAALTAEASGNPAEAAIHYETALQLTNPTRKRNHRGASRDAIVEAEEASFYGHLWLERRCDAMASLSRWSDIVDDLDSHFSTPGLKLTTQDSSLLVTYLNANAVQITEGEEAMSKFLSSAANLRRLLSVESHSTLRKKVESETPIEWGLEAILSDPTNSGGNTAVGGGIGLAQAYATRAIRDCTQKWASLPLCAVGARFDTLAALQRSVEFSDLVEICRGRLDGEEALRRWAEICPHPRDKPTVWASVLAVRSLAEAMDPRPQSALLLARGVLAAATSAIALGDFSTTNSRLEWIHGLRCHFNLTDPPASLLVLQAACVRNTVKQAGFYDPTAVDIVSQWRDTLRNVLSSSDIAISAAEKNASLGLLSAMATYSFARTTRATLRLLFVDSLRIRAAMAEDPSEAVRLRVAACQHSLRSLISGDEAVHPSPSSRNAFRAATYSLLADQLLPLTRATTSDEILSCYPNELANLAAETISGLNFPSPSTGAPSAVSLAALYVHTVTAGISLGSFTSTNSILHCIALAAKYSHYSISTHQFFLRCLTSIPTWVFLRNLAQLTGHLAVPETRPIVLSILILVARDYPDALRWPFHLTRRLLDSAGREAVVELDHCLMTTATSQFAESIFCLMNPEHRWKGYLDRLNRIVTSYYTPNSKSDKKSEGRRITRDTTGFLSAEEKTSLQEEATAVFEEMELYTLSDRWPALGTRIGSYNRRWAKQMASSLRTIRSAKTTFFQNTHKNAVAVLQNLQNSATRYSEPLIGKHPLTVFCEWLAEYRPPRVNSGEESLQLPGEFAKWLHGPPPSGFGTLNRVVGFAESVSVLSSIRRPKRVVFLTSSGQTHVFLAKGGEDLRTDERIQQLFRVLNTILATAGSSDSGGNVGSGWGSGGESLEALLSFAPQLSHSDVSILREKGIVPQIISELAFPVSTSVSTKKGKETLFSSYGSKYHARTFSVTPLTTETGLLEWVPNTRTLDDLLSTEMARDPLLIHLNPSALTTSNSTNGSSPQIEIALLDSTKRHEKWIGKHTPAHYHATYKSQAEEGAVALFKELQSTIPRSYLRQFLLRHTLSAEAFLTLRNSLLNSIAVNSLYGWLLGLGDRHLGNILIDVKSGESVAIDFGYCFGIGAANLPVPELIPFRLTPQLLGAFGPLDGKALLRPILTEMLRILRSANGEDPLLGGDRGGEGIIVNELRVFLDDPVMDWVGGQKRTSVPQDTPDTTSPSDQVGPTSGTSQSYELSLEDLLETNPNQYGEVISRRILHALRKFRGDDPTDVLCAELDANIHLAKDPSAKAAVLQLVQATRAKALQQLGDEASEMDHTNVEVEILLTLATDPNVLVRQWGGLRAWI